MAEVPAPPAVAPCPACGSALRDNRIVGESMEGGDRWIRRISCASCLAVTRVAAWSEAARPRVWEYSPQNKGVGVIGVFYDRCGSICLDSLKRGHHLFHRNPFTYQTYRWDVPADPKAGTELTPVTAKCPPGAKVRRDLDLLASQVVCR